MKAPVFQKLHELVDFARGCSSVWFNEETMQYFGTQLVDPNVYGNRYFITRERSRLRFTDNAYMVRFFDIDIEGMINIKTAEYEGFKTLKEAIGFIKGMMQADADRLANG